MTKALIKYQRIHGNQQKLKSKRSLAILISKSISNVSGDKMLNGKRYATINTDASLKEGVMGYAVWIRTEWDKHQFNGAGIRGKSINEIEMEAIIAGFQYLIYWNLLDDIDVIVVNTDSKEAILNFEKPHTSKYKEAEKFLNLKEFIPQPIYFKKVKGHSKGHDARHYINTWCDAEARRARIAYENLLKQKAHGCVKI